MNRLQHQLSSKTEADLQKLVEPLASYIAAVEHQKVVLLTTSILLLECLAEINASANRSLASFSEIHIG